MYASHLDSHIYAYYAAILQTAYEDKLRQYKIESNPIAYRKIDGKCNIDFANEAFQHIALIENGVAIAADVSDFFGSLDHRILKDRWRQILDIDDETLPDDHYAVFKSITKFSFIERPRLCEILNISSSQLRKKHIQFCCIPKFKQIVKTHKDIIKKNKVKGIPQGSPISAILSNIYMLNYDIIMSNIANDKGAYYRRYSDDILLICKKEDEDFFTLLIYDLLGAYNLQGNTNKHTVSQITYHDGQLEVLPPFQYLGFMYDGKHTLIRSSTIARQKRRALQAIRSATRSARKNEDTILRKKKLYSLYSHLKNKTGNKKTKKTIRSNFYTYVRRSYNRTNAPSIKRQMKNHWPWLNQKILESERTIQEDAFREK